MSGMPYEKWRRQNVTSPSMAIDRHNMVTGAMNTADLERQAKEAARVHGEAADEVRDNWRDAGGDILSSGRETFTALDRFAQDASWGMSSSISNFLYNAKDGFADLGDFAVAVFDSIWRASANMAGDQITGFITSGIGSLFSGGPAPGGFGRASAANPSVVGFDSGGWLMEPVSGVGLNTGRRYELAEHGPELVSNPRRGQVGGDVIVNVYEAPRGTRVERSTVNGSRQLDIFIGEAVKRRLKAGDHELRSLVRGA
jgi:phage-related minor tail protein